MNDTFFNVLMYETHVKNACMCAHVGHSRWEGEGGSNSEPQYAQNNRPLRGSSAMGGEIKEGKDKISQQGTETISLSLKNYSVFSCFSVNISTICPSNGFVPEPHVVYSAAGPIPRPHG